MTTIPPSINPLSASASPPPLLSPQRPTLRSASAISRDRYSAVAGRAAEEAEKLAAQQAAQNNKQVSLPAKSDRDFDDRNDRNDRNDRSNRPDNRNDRNERGSERRMRDSRQQPDNRRNGIPNDLPNDRIMNRSSDRQQDRQSDRQNDRQRMQQSSSSANATPRSDRWGRDDRDRNDRNDRSNDRMNDRDSRDRMDRNDRNDRDSRDRNDSRRPRDDRRDDRVAGRPSSYSSNYSTQSSTSSQASASSSSSSQSALTKSIPSSLGPSPHMLHHKWTLYFDRRAAAKPKPASTFAGSSTSFDTTEYESNLVVVGTIVSVESFWQYWRAIVPPSQLEANSNYHLFRCAADGSPIKPTWEDPSNSKGGKWTIKWHARDKDRFDAYALNICLALIGQQIGAGDTAADQLISGDEINGCVISRRRTGDRLSVWNKSSDEAIVKQIGQSVKQLCVGDSQSQVTLNYDVFEALTH